MSNSKRQKLGEVDFDSPGSHQMPRPPDRQRGTLFLEGIRKLGEGGMEQVHTQLSLPYTDRVDVSRKGAKKRTYRDTPKTITTNATIGINRPSESSDFTQGMLMPMGKTSYFDNGGKGKAIPSSMTLKTATMEGRGMKFLTMDGTKYTPKNDIFADSMKPDSEAKSKGKNFPEEAHWGGLAIGSFLEDVTAKRGLGLSRVGSAMRAKTMASKWKMQNSGDLSDDDFGSRMLKAFPQLGKQKMGAELGASALYQELRAGGAREAKVLNHHSGVSGSIYGAHYEARTAAKERFDEKIKSGAGAAAQGSWWAEKAKTVDFSTITQPGNAKQLKDLRREYTQTKLERHAITYAAGPRHVAAAEAKSDLANRGIVKANNPALYKQEKHNYIVNAMTSGGFNTTKVQKYRDIKDKFDAKFAVAQGGTAVTGGWWGGKANSGTDFTKVDPAKRKELKQEYFAYKKAK